MRLFKLSEGGKTYDIPTWSYGLSQDAYWGIFGNKRKDAAGGAAGRSRGTTDERTSR